MFLRDLAKSLALPPGLFLVTALLGLLWTRRRRRAGMIVMTVSTVGLFVLSLPWVGATLLRTLGADDPLPLSFRPSTEQAIVVLAADHDANGVEYGGPTVGPMTLVRLRYAASLARSTGLPILVSGGIPAMNLPSLARLMSDALAADFRVETRWLEEQSSNTWENARCSADLLKTAGIDSIILVTHAWHMPRARASFEAQGVRVTSAPTSLRLSPRHGMRLFLPSSLGLRESYLAMHEWLGRAGYALLE